MKRNRKALIIFMRYPEEGKVKTRLAASVGAQEATRIYEKLVRRTLGLAGDFVRARRGEVEALIAFSPIQERDRIQKAYPGPWTFFPQVGDHLGERMERAVLHAMALGYGSVVLTGTDLVDTQVSDFGQAFDVLERGGNECAVLSPAADGGFFLIGLNRPCPSAFRPEQWGSEEICLRTEKLLCEAGFRVQKLKTRKDIDRPEDLAMLRSRPVFRSTLSVIIPTLSSPKRLSPFIAFLESCLWPGDEIVAVQGGGGTREEVESEGGTRSRWIMAPKGRGVQMNHGARAARGDTFLFLHDDSLPPPNFAYSVRKIREAPGMSLGCFGLGFSPSTPVMKMVAGGANLRTRLLKLPFGDQGLFCRREIFEKAGGFKKPYLMEDVEFVRECRRLGGLMILPETIFTSPRRYLSRGIVRAVMENQLLLLLHRLGASDRSLYSFYYRQ